jgi:hypothetical protein
VFVASLAVISFGMIGMNPNKNSNNSQFQSNLRNNGSQNSGFTAEQLKEMNFRSMMNNIRSKPVQFLLFNKWLSLQRLTMREVTLDHLLRFNNTQFKQWLKSQPSQIQQLPLKKQVERHEIWKNNIESAYVK